MQSKSVLLGAMCLVLAGCAQTPPQDVATLTAPADASLGIRPVKPINALGGYEHRKPVEPTGWRRSNEGQAPGGAGS